VGMTLPTFLQVGMMLRRQAGIDALERILMGASIDNEAQEALRDHALHALRCAQQRLLGHVLQLGAASAEDAIAQVLAQLKMDARTVSFVQQKNLAQAALIVWTLSEAVSSLRNPG